MELEKLFADCAATTKSKGFNVENYVAQLLLMGTEISEALENLIPKDSELYHYQHQFQALMDAVENSRRNHAWNSDWEWSSHLGSPDRNFDNFLEELADLQIRLGSFVDGNGLTDGFKKALESKGQKNKERAFLHGKKN